MHLVFRWDVVATVSPPVTLFLPEWKIPAKYCESHFQYMSVSSLFQLIFVHEDTIFKKKKLHQPLKKSRPNSTVTFCLREYGKHVGAVLNPHEPTKWYKAALRRVLYCKGGENEEPCCGH